MVVVADMLLVHIVRSFGLMGVDWQHIAELALMGVLSFAGTFGGIRARLSIVEKSTDHAHQRIDTLLAKGR